MTQKTQILAIGLLVALVLSMLPKTGLVAANCQRVRSRCCVPAYRYGHDELTVRGRVVAIADPARTVTWQREETRSVNGVNQKLIAEEQIQRKPFHFPAASLTVDHISLDRVGLAIYSNGNITATGRVAHNGGPNGELAGNAVAIRLRVYAGRTGSRAELADAPMIWHTSTNFWVRRDVPEVISLTSSFSSEQATLRRHFNEITHLEVELIYQRDR